MQAPEGSHLEQWIGRIDRRLIYLGLFLITLTPLIGKWSLPLYPTPPARKLAETVAALPKDKVVFIASSWDAGTQAENRPQFIAVVRHLIRLHLRFVVYSLGVPNGPQLADTAVKEAIRTEGAQDRWLYGREWVNLGFRLASDIWVRSFVHDIPGAAKEDWKGTPVSQIPVLRGVKTFGADGQASMLIEFTGSDTVNYYQFLSPLRAKYGLGCTAVMAPDQYPFLDSGQLSGLLTGMKGAAEYEQLIGARGFGTAAMAGQSFAHLYILVLIVLGNLSLLSSWRERRRGRRALARAAASDSAGGRAPGS